MIRVVRVIRSGKGMHLNIPRPIADALQLTPGINVAVGLENGRMVVARIDERALLRGAIQEPLFPPSSPES